MPSFLLTYAVLLIFASLKFYTEDKFYSPLQGFQNAENQSYFSPKTPPASSLNQQTETFKIQVLVSLACIRQKGLSFKGAVSGLPTTRPCSSNNNFCLGQK